MSSDEEDLTDMAVREQEAIVGNVVDVGQNNVGVELVAVVTL